MPWLRLLMLWPIYLSLVFCSAASSKQCGQNEMYTECGTACPLTCDNHKNPDTQCTRNCIVGCVCKDGYVLHQDKCIRPEKCPNEDVFVCPESSGDFADPREQCSNQYYWCAEGVARKQFCSDTMVFNPVLRRCDTRNNVDGCIHSEEPRPFSCPKLQGNFPHPTSPCGPVFYSCHLGVGLRNECVEGEIFNVDTSSCDLPDYVFACKELIPQKKHDCRGKPNGMYHEGCSAWFYWCWDFEASRHKCPDDRYFNEKKQQCDFFQNVYECTGVYETTTPYRTTPIPRFSCKQRSEGHYADPDNSCSGIYFSCANGHSFEMFCPEGLLYHSGENQCLQPADVPGCEDVVPTMRTFTPSPPPTTPSDQRCRGIPDGSKVPAGACERIYVICNGGLGSDGSCTSDQVFDPNSRQCQPPNAVKTCDRTPNNPTTPRYATTATPTTISPQPTIQADSRCNGGNGDFAMGPCLRTFVWCYNGRAQEQRCDQGQLFDIDTRRCVEASKLSCQSNPTIPPTTGPTTTRSSLDNRCNRNLQGDYPLAECSARYVWCLYGQATELSCNPGFIFDSKDRICKQQSLVAACQKPTQDPQVSTRTRCSPTAQGDFAVEDCDARYVWCFFGRETKLRCPGDSLFDPASRTCKKRSSIPTCGGKQPMDLNSKCPASGVGDFLLSDCSTQFVWCWNGRGSLKECQNKLIFDEESKTCKDRQEVKKCAPARHRSYVPFVTAQDTAVLQPQDPACVSQPEGVFMRAPNDCTKFLRCLVGKAIEMQCPEGLVFNTADELCDSPANVTECVHHQDAICSGFPDWTLRPHESDCSKFYECTHGHAVVFDCPMGLGFNPAQNYCDWPENVPGCGAPTGTEPPPSSDPGSASCESRAAGIYALGDCSSKFLRCDYGQAHVMSCAVGELFDPTELDCVPLAQLTACASTTSPPLDVTTPQVRDPRCPPAGDGDFATGNCDPWFLRCSYGFAKQLRCAGRQVFNSVSRTCAQPEYVPTCGSLGIALSTSPPILTTPQSDTTTPQPRRRVDKRCTGSDGDFATGACKPFFVRCYAGQGQKLACDNGDIFDPVLRVCRSRSLVSSCYAQPTTLSPPPLDVTTIAPTIAPDSRCPAGASGDFPTGLCEPWFVRCLYGQGRLFSCNNDQVFDSVTRHCRSPSVVASCSPLTTEAPLPFPTTQPVFTFETTLSDLTMATAKPSDVRCPTYGEGDFATAPCDSWFLWCLNGIGRLQQCSPGFVFDSVMRLCREPGLVASCTVVTTLPTTIQADTTPESTAECPAAAQGDFPVGACDQQFVRCYNGIGVRQSCFDGMAFDIETSVCRDIQLVRACGSTPATTQQPPEDVPSGDSRCPPIGVGDFPTGSCNQHFVRCYNGQGAVILCQSANEVFDSQLRTCRDRALVSTCIVTTLATPTVIPTAPPTSSQCTYGQDGFVPTGPCEQWYLFCYAGTGQLSQCDNGLVFDPIRLFCADRNSISSCGFQQNPTDTTVLPETTQEPTLPTNPDNRCYGVDLDFLPNGPCSRDYTVCFSGVGRPLNCAEGQVFDRAGKKCVDRGLLLACVGTPANPSRDITLCKPEPWGKTCQGKPDGFYFVETCGPFFVACFSNQEKFYRCPEGLVYNPSTGRCQRSAELSDCITTQTTATMPPTMPPTVATLPPQTTIRDTLSCAGRFDGLFPIKQNDFCQTQYFACFSGVLSTHECPQGRVFDPTSAQCAFNPSCNGPGPTFSCVGLQDGVYAISGDACATQFASCMQGQALIHDCLAGTVYNANSAQCVIIPACIPGIPADSVTTPAPTLPPFTFPSTSVPTQTLPVFPQQGQQVYQPDQSQFQNQDFYGAVQFPNYPGFEAYFQSNQQYPAAGSPYSFAGDVGTGTGFSDSVYGGDNAFNLQYPFGSQDYFGSFDALSQQYSVPGLPQLELPADVTQYAQQLLIQTQGVATPSPIAAPQQTPVESRVNVNIDQSTFCQNRANGVYAADWCSGKFICCLNLEFKWLDCSQFHVFDANLLRCVPQNQCVPPRTTQQSPPDINTNLCVSQPDGRYQITPCLGLFVMCSAQQLSFSSCPSGTTFDQATGVCNFDPRCSGQAPQQDPATFCVGKGNGVFAVDFCNTQFVCCLQGEFKLLGCPPSHVFDSTQSRCVLQNICVTPARAEPAPRIEDRQVCLTQGDGVHAIAPCIGIYFQCTGGQLSYNPCANGNVFDATVAACVPLLKCQANLGQADVTVPTPPPPSCNGVPEAAFPMHQCDQCYIFCSHGQNRWVCCNTGELFDSNVGRCVPGAQCTFSAPNTCTASAESNNIALAVCAPCYGFCWAGQTNVRCCDNDFVYDANINACVPPAKCLLNQNVPIGFCGTAEGAVGPQCGACYIVCWQGQAKVQCCNSGNVFDNAARGCVTPTECVAQQTEQSPVQLADPSVTGSIDFATPYAADAFTGQTYGADFGLYQDFGGYGLGGDYNQPAYANGFGASDLSYNPLSSYGQSDFFGYSADPYGASELPAYTGDQFSNYQYNSPLYGLQRSGSNPDRSTTDDFRIVRSRRSVSADNATLTSAAPSVEENRPIQTAESLPAPHTSQSSSGQQMLSPDFCQDKWDGKYAFPNQVCWAFYYFCADRITYVNNCPRGYAFDVSYRECTPQMYCGQQELPATNRMGMYTQQPTMIVPFYATNFVGDSVGLQYSNSPVFYQAYPAYQSQYYSQPYGASPSYLRRTYQQPQVDETTCQKLENGNYSIPNQACTVQYVECWQQQTYLGRCRSGVYDPKMKDCVPRHLCSSLVDEELKLVDCKGKANDSRLAHPRKCERFFVCTGEKPTLQTCVKPAPAFNPATLLCDSYNNVPQCRQQAQTSRSGFTFYQAPVYTHSNPYRVATSWPVQQVPVQTSADSSQLATRR